MNWTTLFKKFTNGKYIVGLLTVVFLSIGSFTSANEIICNNSCEIDTNNKQGCFLEINSCNGSEGTFAISPQENGETIQDLEYNSCQGISLEIQENYQSLYIYNYEDKGFTLDYNINCGTEEENGTIIEGGTSNFTPIITKLGNIAGEFIPYMLYIAIACLGISLVYGALKYILGYLQDKAKGTMGREGMKERRRRRRRNRRFIKSVNNQTYQR